MVAALFAQTTGITVAAEFESFVQSEPGNEGGLSCSARSC
jgi:hypothetical protein